MAKHWGLNVSKALAQVVHQSVRPCLHLCVNVFHLLLLQWHMGVLNVEAFQVWF